MIFKSRETRIQSFIFAYVTSKSVCLGHVLILMKSLAFGHASGDFLTLHKVLHT